MGLIIHTVNNERYFNLPDQDILLDTVQHAGDKNRLKRTKAMMRQYPPSHIILDSGTRALYLAEKEGRQILSDPNLPIFSKSGDSLNLTPEHTLQAAESLGANVLIAMSRPPQEKKTEEEQQMEFRNKLDLNIQFAIDTERLLDGINSKMVFLVPIHARNTDEFQEYSDAIKEVRLSGVSLSCEGLSNSLLIEFVKRLTEMGSRWGHIRGVSSFEHMLIAEHLMVEERMRTVFIDTSSWARPGISTPYLDPYTLKAHNFNDDIVTKLQADCGCPFCRIIFESNRKTKSEKEREQFLLHHNTWVFSRAKGAIENCFDLDCSEYRWFYKYYRDFYQTHSKSFFETIGLLEDNNN